MLGKLRKWLRIACDVTYGVTWLQAEVRKKTVEREEEERRRSRKIKDINRMEEQEKELLLQIYACKMVDVKVDTEDIKNNQEKGKLVPRPSFENLSFTNFKNYKKINEFLRILKQRTKFIIFYTF